MGMPVEQRAVLTLRDAEGLTYDEIGGILKVPPGTVRSRLNRARACFRMLVVKRGLEVGV